MLKPQFVVTAVVLEGWGKLKGANSYAVSAPIEGARPSTRRALSVAVCQHRSVRRRHIAVSIGAAAVATWALQSAPIPSAQAAPCPDAEVVFARGTTEAPGVGPTGEAFVDSLRSRVGAKSVGVYAVDYPATTDFPTAVDGITDARAHVLATAANCPRTKMVLGGFSQGAAVMGFVTANAVPDGVSPLDVPAPMPPEVANHVAAVALFGKPSTRFMRAINDPPITVGQQYVAKTIDLCVDDDLVCDSDGRSFSAHNQYVETGMVDQGVTFVANQLQASWGADGLVPPSAGGASPSPQTPPTPLPLSAPAAPVAPPAPAAGGAGPTPHLPAAPLTPPGPPAAPVAPPPPVAAPGLT
jgi:cutinase-like protein